MPLAGLQNLTGIRVLAVDDEADSRGLLRVVLEAAGATVTTAGSAAEALGMLESNPPDVLIADIGMPEMDGFALIKHVRTLPNPVAAQVPAAALTAFARSEDRTRALLAGYQVHIAKPVEPAELVATLASLTELIKNRRD